MLWSSHTRGNVSSSSLARRERKRADVVAKGSVNGSKRLRSSTESRADEVIVALTVGGWVGIWGGGERG